MSGDTGGKIVVGKVTGAYGVKGWVKVYSWTDPMENIANYDPWFMKEPNAEWRKVTLEKGKRHGKTVVAKLEGVDDRDAAILLTGQEIAIEESQIEPLGEDEFYWRELIGLRVTDQQGHALGVVKELMETGANDVLVVQDEGLQRLIPWALGDIVITVDLVDGFIEVDWDASWDTEGEG